MQIAYVQQQSITLHGTTLQHLLQQQKHPFTEEQKDVSIAGNTLLHII